MNVGDYLIFVLLLRKVDGSAYLEKKVNAGVAPIRNVSVVRGAIGGTISLNGLE